MNEKNQLTVTFNGGSYLAKYNEQTDYYEIDLEAPSEKGGIYVAELSYTNSLQQKYEDSIDIQVFIKEAIKVETNKVFMWIFDYKDFSVKDIVEIADYEINIDEETNKKTIIKVLKKNTAKARDIIAIKKNNEVVYWGTIENISNEDGNKLYEYTIKYITNIFDQTVELKNENIIKETGVEDFIADAIYRNFITNEDTFVNLAWLEIEVKTHTKKQTSVTNVENNIYNLHTWATNCTQNYDIVYSFSIANKKFKMTIESKEYNKELIDVIAQAISNYSEVFETDVVSKVIVLYNKKNGVESKGNYTLYLLIDRTTTTDKTNQNRAEGRTITTFTENFEDAEQTALDSMKSNLYNHNITFNYYDRFLKVGTPIAIKTRESLIFDTYISAIKITNSKFIEYTCGNIRINLIDKLLKERKN